MARTLYNSILSSNRFLKFFLNDFSRTFIPSIIERRKWSPTANDPQIEPQMIPDLQWSRTSNDPRCGPQMIPPEKENGMEFGFPDFKIFFLFIYFRQLNDELDKHNEKIFCERRWQLEYNSPEKKIILLTIFLKNYWKKIKACWQQYHFLTSWIYNNNSLMVA